MDRSECTVDGDCPGDGATCRRIPDVEGATRFCAYPRVIARYECTDGGTPYSCCTDSDCGPIENLPPGLCLDFQLGYCGGPAPPEDNLCRYDACTSDATCGGSMACVPAGVRGLITAECVARHCATDAECTEGAGGQCRLLSGNGCTGLVGFFCTYDDDPCRQNSDCSGGDVCVPDGDSGTRCEELLLPP